MIRVLVALVHTVLGAGATTGGLLVLAQASANGAWEVGFYGARSDATWTMVAAAALTITVGVVEAVSAVGWFAGSRRAASWLMAIGFVLALGAPLPVAALLLMTVAVVGLDAVVMDQRAAGGPPPG